MPETRNKKQETRNKKQGEVIKRLVDLLVNTASAHIDGGKGRVNVDTEVDQFSPDKLLGRGIQALIQKKRIIKPEQREDVFKSITELATKSLKKKYPNGY